MFRQGVSQIITEMCFIYYLEVLCYIHDLNTFITGRSLSGLFCSGQGHLCAVTAQSGNTNTKARRLSWGGMWDAEQTLGQNFQLNLGDIN